MNMIRNTLLFTPFNPHLLQDVPSLLYKANECSSDEAAALYFQKIKKVLDERYVDTVSETLRELEVIIIENRSTKVVESYQLYEADAWYEGNDIAIIESHFPLPIGIGIVTAFPKHSRKYVFSAVMFDEEHESSIFIPPLGD